MNIALRQLNAPQFPAQVAAALAESGLPPSALTIEVGERMLVEDAGLIADRLAELRDLGVKLAIDDFGTGYASLAHLRQLPADIIKIDPSFVSGLGQDPILTLLTRTIVQVGRDLGMQVVAEGHRAAPPARRAAGDGLRLRPGLPGRQADGRLGRRGADPHRDRRARRASSARDRRGGRRAGRQRHDEAGRPRRVGKFPDTVSRIVRWRR